MFKDFKKAKETQDEIEQINRSLRNPKGVNIEKLKKRKEELEIVKFKLDQEGSMKFLDCMAEITSNVPIVGDTYSEVIKKLGQKIIPISNYSFNYSEVIRLYKEMAFGPCGPLHPGARHPALPRKDRDLPPLHEQALERRPLCPHNLDS